MNIHLLEANQSPQLLRGGKYESIVHDTLSVSLLNSLQTNKLASLRLSDINVLNQICYTSACESCDNRMCRLCIHCLRSNEQKMLMVSMAEHLYRGNLRRTYPTSQMPNEALKYNAKNATRTSRLDQINMKWLQEKCARDLYWCT
ncbi:probable tubulin polyglutamylase ttll-15 [Amphiura filiformis]|uniref:probable tubulin polyglutamylase ttll-15 n=1 Tax=Amphiura filiformis TaxID=82378 RepID=UPI003B21F6BD